MPLPPRPRAQLFPQSGNGSADQVCQGRAARAADPNVQIAALNAIEKRWMQQTATLSEEGQKKAEVIAKSMRAIVNGKTSLESAASYFADVLGCEPEEIGGQANG